MTTTQHEAAVIAAEDQHDSENGAGTPVPDLAEDLIRDLSAEERDRDRVVNDITIIASMLKTEAENREWCSEYEGFTERVNALCSQPWLRPCAREMSMQMTVAVTLSVPSDQYDSRANEVAQAVRQLLRERGDVTELDVEVCT